VTLHLVEVGLTWPPDSFLLSKFEGLARRGVRVTVVATPGGAPDGVPPGIGVVRLPNTDHRVLLLGPAAAADCLRLAVSDRRRLLRVLRAVARLPRPSSLRRRLGWVRMFARLEPLCPDVVQFEWESAAIRYLPLVDFWGCPMVMSCRGGLDLYSQSPTHRAALNGVAEAFERATAVHCVSDAMRAEAERHGLDPRRAPERR
jgi:hypothetical protein